MSPAPLHDHTPVAQRVALLGDLADPTGGRCARQQVRVEVERYADEPARVLVYTRRPGESVEWGEGLAVFADDDLDVLVRALLAAKAAARSL